MGLRGLYDEVQAGEDRKALEGVLEGYEKVLVENPVHVVCISVLCG